MVELLAPAGSIESLQAAVHAGADAVYIGGSLFGARAYADNPDEEQLKQGIEYCHLHGRKLYMTVNTLLKEKELETLLYLFLLPYYECGVDGLIVQDLGVVRFVHQHFPGLEVHASTQMTVTSAHGARLLGAQGITRVVPARELSLPEIRRIIDETGIEVETFIHGAMCYSYSGQCLLSSMIGGRSGNRGRCAQPCRLPYSLPETGKSCLLSMKDMCTLKLLPDLIDAGIASLKIEGRMKRPEYTAGVVSIYRKYIDLYQAKGRKAYHVDEDDLRILMDLYNRGGFSEGYYQTRNGKTMMAMVRPNHQGTKAARVKSVSRGKLEAVALEALNRQDVLELSRDAEVTLAREVRPGETFTLATGNARVGRDAVIYRTKNERLLEQLREQYVVRNYKENIKGELRIFRDSPAILTLWCKEASVTVSAAIAEAAMNNPTPEETVRRQMNKTGNTPFAFETLDVRMDDGLFVSIKGLNELRRSGLEQLTEALLIRAGRRTMPPQADRRESDRPETTSQTVIHDPAEGQKNDGPAVTVLVTTREQLGAVLSCERMVPDTVYLDTLLFGFAEELDAHYGDLEQMIAQIQSRGSRCFLNFPPVLRELDQKLLTHPRMRELLGRMDGCLLHTVDELAFAQRFCQETGKVLILAADDSLYAYNRTAVEVLKEQGITRRTLPAELNFRELGVLAGHGTELNVYGYQPLMQSAQCLVKNTKGCTGIPTVTYLTDRKNARFPVRTRCNVCCNTIYNSVPLQLGGCAEELAQLAPDYLRLSFTVEDAAETARILKLYHSLLAEGHTNEAGLEGTRGHFRRGVE
jgi:putative protease